MLGLASCFNKQQLPISAVVLFISLGPWWTVVCVVRAPKVSFREVQGNSGWESEVKVF